MLNTVLRMFFKYSYLVLISLQLVSCKKAADRSCFKTWGSDTTRTVSLPSFNKLEVYEQMEFVLIQDSTDKLVIHGGDQVVNFIEFEVGSDKKLTIRNRNKCNFLRSFKKKIRVEIHFSELVNVYTEGTEPMYSKDTIVADYFTLFIRDGAGSVDLKLKSKYINADITHGWGDYTLSGKTDFARLAAKSNGFCNTYGLQIKDSADIVCQTSGKMKIHADQILLKISMLSNGIVEYKGVPSAIKVEQIGTGKVINAN
jgi:hypothetical protein